MILIALLQQNKQTHNTTQAWRAEAMHQYQVSVWHNLYIDNNLQARVPSDMKSLGVQALAHLATATQQ